MELSPKKQLEIWTLAYNSAMQGLLNSGIASAENVSNQAEIHADNALNKAITVWGDLKT